MRDPLPYVESVALAERRDIVILDEARGWSYAQKVKGEHRYYPNASHSENDFQQYNTGFKFFIPTESTKIFLDTLVEAWPLNFHLRTDQLVFNAIIHGKRFTPRMKVHMLDFKKFISGALFRSNGRMKGEWTHSKHHALPNKMPEDFYVLHASDVTSHLRKITKFNNVGHWYLTPEACPVHYTECKETTRCLPSNMDTFLKSDGSEHFDKKLALHANV